MNRRTFVTRLAASVVAPAVVLSLPESSGAVPLSISGVVAAGGDSVNIRTGPSTSRALIHSAPDGTPLQLLQTSGDWFKVRTGSYTGWAHSGLIEVQGTPSKMLHRGVETRPRVALTFDASNDAALATEILDLLAYFRIYASFGLTGSWAKRHPDLLRRMVSERHQLLNHGLNHLSFTGFSTSTDPLTPAKRIAQLVATEDAFIRIAGKGAGAYWRPPYSDYDAASLRQAGAIKLSRCAMYTIDSLGWNGLSAAEIRDRVLGQINWGGIVKFHIGDGAQDGYALESIIRSLRNSGYQFGTVRQTVLPSS